MSDQSPMPPHSGPPQSGLAKYRTWIIVVLVIVILARFALFLIQGRL